MIATFLDRDGVINKETTLGPDKKITVFSNAAEAVKMLNKIGKVIVVTNQPWIARGMLTEEELEGVHREMVEKLAASGAKIDSVYYCPHHPEIHHKDVPDWARKYRVDCSCRKPKTGMLEQAALDFKLDLKKCFLVGDRTVDILAGRNAGCTTILVRTGEAGMDGKYEASPDYVCEDIYDAALIISGIMKGEK
ncbi:MAG: HAD family hydrolase [Candidatus Aenigmarchaeota archaeon]|nr:HAD family hydrolase [Candidatus Aenigmarchaeota archaeon]